MNLNKSKQISISFFLIVFLFSVFSFLFSDIVLAAEQNNIDIACKNYQYPWCSETKEGIAPLVNNFYKIALGLAGASALGVLIYGSILWTLSGAVTSKQDAMEWISGALWGLALLLGAYLILNTINPQLTILKEPGDLMKPVSVPAPQRIGNTVIGESKLLSPEFSTKYYYENNPEFLNKATDKSNWTEEQKKNLYSHDEAMAILNKEGIKVKSSAGVSGVCADQSSSQCKTSFNGIPKDTLNLYIKTVTDFRKTNPTEAAKIQATGGTESAVKHKEQGFGYPSLDTTYNKAYYDFVNSRKDQYGVVVQNENTTGSSGNINIKHATGSHTSFYTNEAAAKRGGGNIGKVPYTTGGGVR